MLNQTRCISPPEIDIRHHQRPELPAEPARDRDDKIPGFYPQNLHDNTFILLLLKLEYSDAVQWLA